MLPNELPPCPFCSTHGYRPGNSSLGALIQQTFFCSTCKAVAQYVSETAYYGQPRQESLVYFEESAIVQDDPGFGGSLPDAYVDWVNDILLPAWRVRAEKYVDWKAAEKLLLPEAEEFVPLTFQVPVYPPKIPTIAGVVFLCRMFEFGKWAKVDPVVSAAQVLEEDPILRKNRELFELIFDLVSVSVGAEIVPSEAKNEYGGIQPWYTFTLNGCAFTVGWRKRVVSISVDAPRGVPTAEIRALAERDQVTFEVMGPMEMVTADIYEADLQRERPENPDTHDRIVARLVKNFREEHPEGALRRRPALDPNLAHQVLIHAWGQDKVIEYLTVLCRSVL